MALRQLFCRHAFTVWLPGMMPTLTELATPEASDEALAALLPLDPGLTQGFPGIGLSKEENELFEHRYCRKCGVREGRARLPGSADAPVRGAETRGARTFNYDLAYRNLESTFQRHHTEPPEGHILIIPEELAWGTCRQEVMVSAGLIDDAVDAAGFEMMADPSEANKKRYDAEVARVVREAGLGWAVDRLHSAFFGDAS